MQQATDDLELLLIDDNPADIYLIRQMLQSSPLHIKNIYETNSIDSACQVLKDGNIHLALLDLSLPDSFGIQSFLGIKQVSKKIPVIILTALADESVGLEAIKEGAQDYLIKGEFDSHILTRSIQYSFERLQNMETMQQLNERVLFHIENGPLGFIEWDDQLLVKFWSRRTEEIFGWTYRDFIESNRTGYSQVYEEDQPWVFKIAEQLLSGSVERNSLQHRNYKKDGSVIWCEWFNSVQRDKNGKVIAIMSLVQDITERKKAEAAIRESEERYRNIVETTQEGIWVIDENNFTNFANKKLAEILEYSPEEMMGRHTFDFMDDEGKELAAKEIKQQENELTNNREFKFITKSGRQVWTNISTNPIFSGDRKYKGALAMVTEVTEQKKLKQELAEEQKQKQLQITAAVLEAQEKERVAIGEELHDNINQIMGAAMMYINVARNNPEERDELLSKSVEYIRMAIEENRKLAKELILPQLKGLGLSQALGELTNQIKQTSSFKIILAIKDFDEAIFTEQQKVSLYRIVQEHMNNIVKHSQATAVTICLSKENSKMILSISDNGKGFDPSVRNKGVGLTNISSRAEVLNGNVEIETAPGKGCTLKVVLDLI